MQRLDLIRATDPNDLEQCFALRREVFVVEQQVDEAEEYDEFETRSHHYLARRNGQPVGTARWRVTPEGKVKLERIAVRHESRKQGIGAALVRAMLADIPPGYTIYMHAQTHALPFYQLLGFVGEGELFWEAGIEHQRMVYQKPSPYGKP